MTSTTDRPATTGRVRTRRKPRPRRRWPKVVGALLIVLLVAVGWWMWSLASGLLEASRTVQAQAAVAQAELQAFRDKLKLGDEDAAAGHLSAAERALGAAKKAALDDDVRTAKGLPYVGNTVDDLDHLLAAADIMTGSARDALVVYENFSGDDSELFKNSRFSIPAIKEAQESVAAISKDMVRAEKELRAVGGKGPKGGEVLAKKRSGLRQITSLREEIVPLTPVLDALPAAVGANGPRTYLVAIMNPTEMRASGGAPLSVAFVRFKNGKMSIPLTGATSALTGLNRELYWDRLTGNQDPFAMPEGAAERFVNTTFNPSFPVSGEQLVRATPANFGIKTHGVVALDIVAIGHLLDATGPIESADYGTITSKNIAKKLLIKAYQRGSDAASVAARQASNNELMTAMLSRLTEGGGLIGKARALGQAIPGRHLQMYFRDDQLQQVVEDKRLGGAIPDPKAGNLTAVYTQNGNGNKLDIYQRRTVREVVRVRADGSAVVKRTVVLRNPTPPYTAPFPDRRRGYDTRYATNLVINLMPDGAKVLKEPDVLMAGTVANGVDQDGRTYAKAAVMLPPRGSATLTWTYVVPKAAVRRGDALVLRNVIAPQPMLNEPQLQITVVPPRGWTAQPPVNWKKSDEGVTFSRSMDRVRAWVVRMTREG